MSIGLKLAGFSEQGKGARTDYAGDLWARDQRNGTGVKAGPVLHGRAAARAA